MSTPVVGYLRVSTPGQEASGWGLPEQKAKIEEHCARHDCHIVEWVEDGGVSGQREDRPGLSRALALAEAGAVRRVVMAKVDRMGRRGRVIHNALHDFRSRGVAVDFASQPLGDTPADRLLLNTLVGISEF